jgi:hypothetical protein
MTFTSIKRSTGSSIIVSNSVKTSAGSDVSVSNDVLDSDGTSHTLFTDTIVINPVHVTEFALFDNRIFTL